MNLLVLNLLNINKTTLTSGFIYYICYDLDNYMKQEAVNIYIKRRIRKEEGYRRFYMSEVLVKFMVKLAKWAKCGREVPDRFTLPL